MEKQEALDKLFSLPLEQILPITCKKSELYYLNEEEWDKVLKHINMTQDHISSDFDTLILPSVIFKKEAPKSKIKQIIENLADKMVIR